VSAFDDPDWLIVEGYDLDEDAAADPGSFGDFTVSYGDEVAADYQHLVAESISVIRAVPGVLRVLHEDRELIKVWGNVDHAGLDRELRRWWAAQPGTQ
jgi:hypothetical protein